MVCLDLNKEAIFIAEETGCTPEQANLFVELEDVYYDLLGLNVYESDISPKELSSDTVVDDADIIKFVCDRTDMISKGLCERMLEAEYKYFVEIGLVEEG